MKKIAILGALCAVLVSCRHKSEQVALLVGDCDVVQFSPAPNCKNTYIVRKADNTVWVYRYHGIWQDGGEGLHSSYQIMRDLGDD